MIKPDQLESLNAKLDIIKEKYRYQVNLRLRKEELEKQRDEIDKKIESINSEIDYGGVTKYGTPLDDVARLLIDQMDG